jgi:hypothetical protein
MIRAVYLTRPRARCRADDGDQVVPQTMDFQEVMLVPTAWTTGSDD